VVERRKALELAVLAARRVCGVLTVSELGRVVAAEGVAAAVGTKNSRVRTAQAYLEEKIASGTIAAS